MCGTVGMFLGCEAMSSCFLHATRDSFRPQGAQSSAGILEEGTEALTNWDERSAVRTAPRRMVGSDLDSLVPPELVPVAVHPLTTRLDPRAAGALRLQHLYRYLDATRQLELIVVNGVLTDLVRAGTRLLSQRELVDAHRMICDEAYHALTAFDLLTQVSRRQGVDPQLPDEPYFLRRIRARLADQEESRRHLGAYLFVTVSETLISGTLAAAVASGGDDGLRAALRDHAIDEGRHHAFFAGVLPRIWADLTLAERQWAGVIVPGFIDDFLAPDLDAGVADLLGAGLSVDDARHVVHDVYEGDEVTQQRSRAASRTVRHFAELEAFDSTEAQDALAAANLLMDGDES